jgi:hypothetical protein
VAAEAKTLDEAKAEAEARAEVVAKEEVMARALVNTPTRMSVGERKRRSSPSPRGHTFG